MKSNLELLKDLRNITQAGMKDCKDSLEEVNWDMEKAIDLIKTKGLNIVSGLSGKIASEGVVAISRFSAGAGLVEINCQTDFVANSLDFKEFATLAADVVVIDHVAGLLFTVDRVEAERQAVVATTKENIVIRRWWIEEALDPKARVFSYVHSNNKIGVLLTLLAPSDIAAIDPSFIALGNDLAMQIAAMNPLAISADKLDPTLVERQKNIFETQLTELNKPQAAWVKILDGKFNKWYTEVCLENQESVIVPKSSVSQVIKNVGSKLGGEIKIMNFVRCLVGEGIEVEKNDLASEVEKLSR